MYSLDCVRAGLDVGRFACGSAGTSPSSVASQAEVIATAVADAIAEVTTSCCARGSAEVRDIAQSLAEGRASELAIAVAEILASGNVCPRCSAVVDSLSRLSRDTLTEAVGGAWAQVCAVRAAHSDWTPCSPGAQRGVNVCVFSAVVPVQR